MDYIPAKKESILRVDRLYTVHYFEYVKDYVFGGEKHDFWEIAYIDRGTAGIVAENRGYTLKQGDAVFHKPHEYHNIWASGGFANSVIISFSASGKAMDYFKNKILHFDDEDKRLLALIVREASAYFSEPLNIVELPCMTKRKDAPAGGEQMVRLYIEQLLIGLIRKGNLAKPHPISEKSTEEGKEKIVEAIKTYLAENISEPITLDDVVSRVCFSKTFVKALFREKTGMGIIHYLTELRINTAKHLISENKYTFSEIAAMCGFSTIHYFSNCFKKETGMRPSEYSKSVQSKGIL